MEIDLNHPVTEVEKNAFCTNGDSSSSSNSSSSPVSSSIYLELWHACAGPLTSLPNKGNVVVYFPQGHLEQLASSSPFPYRNMPNFDLHPQIFCKVVNVQLLANRENDEVYTRLTLLPRPEVVGQGLEGKEFQELGVDGEGDDASPTKSTPHMFCKTLTASDTSTHGGFSVPRRAAEDCFPSLDYKQQRPSQELVAKDLHGVEWKFRHIYRGQPRRHLLTTGWSIFVSQKNLVSGDAVLFLRGEDGELRLGIRRAGRPRNGLPDSVTGKQNSLPSALSLVSDAISTKSMFTVSYSPRATHAVFVVPYQKYIKSISNAVCTGTRFKMRFEMDDSPERRRSGVVSGTTDLDPYKWPNSKWRCLMVRWDEDVISDHQERVSPWEIDTSVSLPPLIIQSSPRLKKLRSGLQAAPPDKPIAGGGGFLDFEESLRSSKVLQGQENAGLLSPVYRRDIVSHPLDFEVQNKAQQNLILTGIEKAKISELTRAHPATHTGFTESDRFLKVLQGQEICSLSSIGTLRKPNIGCSSFQMYPGPRPTFYPVAAESLRSMYFPYGDVLKNEQDPRTQSYAIFSRENAHSNTSSIQTCVVREEVRKPNQSSEYKTPESISAAPALCANLRNQKDGFFNGNATGCKLFGFSLNAETSPNLRNTGKRSCTKVHKQGSLVGRAIDLSRLNGYSDLLNELERLFSMEGLLQNPEEGWRILYTDSENDVMVVGDDPWLEFCNVATKIHIYTQEEVEKMTIGITGDDTQSCLDQAPVVMEASKSPSVGQPDCSPTVIRV
uniref:Auxin response factor n=1 Tax=Salix viminalis TaxID=40686 RepID=A0A6N2LGI4_SALVM